MLIYLAGPLFCEAERTFNVQLTKKLEEAGFSVFLPQRDGISSDELRSQALTSEEKSRKIFDIDYEHLIQADILLFNLDGRVPDDGACVELGIAYERKQLTDKNTFIIGYKTDWRAFSMDFEINAFIYPTFDKVVNNEEDLFKELKTFQKEHVESN